MEAYQDSNEKLKITCGANQKHPMSTKLLINNFMEKIHRPVRRLKNEVSKNFKHWLLGHFYTYQNNIARQKIVFSLNSGASTIG